MVNLWLHNKGNFPAKYFGCLLGDNERYQKFLEEKQWKMLKKDLTKSVSQRKCAPKVTPAFEKPIEHILKSQSKNRAGILDLSTLCHKPPKPSQQHPYKFVPVHPEQVKGSLVKPHTELVCSVILPHPSLNGLLEKAV